MKEYELTYTVRNEVGNESNAKEYFVEKKPLQALKRLIKLYPKWKVTKVTLRTVKRSLPELDASTQSGNNPPRVHYSTFHLPKGTI